MIQDKTDLNAIAINAAQLLLAEKRTSLAVMRTGIAVFVLPLTIMSFLIVTSKLYDVFSVLHFLIPLAIFCLALIVLGTYLVIRSIIRMQHYNHLILKIKKSHSVIGEFID